MKKGKEILDTFINQYQNHNYVVSLECPDLSFINPDTKKPQYARLRISYVPDQRCLKDFTLSDYLVSYRNSEERDESLINKIREDIVEKVSPKKLQVAGDFLRQNGIVLSVNAEYTKPSSVVTPGAQKIIR